ncbi:vegetatible incompatibility HET-E-1 [Fusarium agapanthi]|uniref:Vegetatible incompatibility HET-E-1 n=1 Tax=Fusarium agapanthi TaxID=1803897 RepID=A0A9P5EB32_9HYPO|nr:vegetatible incompatibility HET-E-1 [Fusarium agapanthi]
MAQYGLLEVYNGENAQADIVFLHGLRGDREKTWTKNGVVWPKDLLPGDIPASRIFLFGYDTNITSASQSGATKTEIHSDAEDVCAKLATERLGTQTLETDSCLKDLYITNPEDDKKRIEHEKGGLLKDCYGWVLYNDNFLQWRDDQEQHLLWIRGDPGKGKTMLLAGLITELEKTSDDGILYFFCQAARLPTELHQTCFAVSFGSLSASDQVCALMFARNMIKLIQKSSLIITLDCIIIIDALDECKEGRENLIGYISQCSVLFKAKWVISSRNWPEIESQLNATQSQVRLHLELNHASISNSVLKFVNRKVTQLNSTYDEPSRERIRKHLLDNANDTFLWVALVCQELEKPGVKHYHSSSILQRFPTGLNDLYERMISDINDRDMRWCRAILAVIAVALRPLSLQELAAADGALIEWVEDKETLSSLVTSCGSLLTIRGDTVFTVHQSVNDFLCSTPKILHSGIAQQQLSIFLSSIKVMQDMLHRNLYELKDNCALLDDIPVLPSAPLTIAGYACIYWVDHFCGCTLTDDQNQNNLYYAMITQLLESKYLYWLEAMSLLRCTSEAIKVMQRLEDKLVEDRVSNDLRLLVQDAVRFASTHRAIMDAAPLQLYDSALMFTPQHSKIKVCFNQEINKSIDLFSPDFQHWDACLHTIPGIGGRDRYWGICEFSPNGQQIAAINSRRDSILFIDASTGGLVKSLESPGGPLIEFTFHPSGDSIVTSSGEKDFKKKLAIFHLPNGEYSKSFTVEKYGWSRPLLFSPDGQLLALGLGHRTVEIWDTAYEKVLASCLTDDVKYVFWKIAEVDRGKDVNCASWVADGRLVALCGTFGIELWDLEAKRLVAQVTGDSTNTICYGRNRQLASLGSRDCTLKIWSLDTILSHSKPIAQQSVSIFKAFIRTSSGKVVAISDNAQSDMLNMAVNDRSYQFPKTPPNSPPGSYYRTESLEFGHDDYFAVATNGGAIDVFNLEHDTGLYYCERRIEEDVVPDSLPYNYLTIEFWGQEQILTFWNDINFWDLKTGKLLRAVSLPSGYTGCRSTIITDGRIALIKGYSEVVVWDIMCGKATQCFDLGVLAAGGFVWNLSLASSGILAILARGWGQDFIAIVNAKDGSWIRMYSMPDRFPTLNFLTPKLRLDTGLGVLEHDMELGGSRDIPTVTAEIHWEPRCLRLYYSESEAWLMKGSRRILWIPRQDVDLQRFSIQPDLKTGKSTVTLVHNGCLFILSIKMDSI